MLLMMNLKVRPCAAGLAPRVTGPPHRARQQFFNVAQQVVGPLAAPKHAARTLPPLDRHQSRGSMTNNRICSTESEIEDRCKHRSSSEDGIDQLFFGQFVLDKLFKGAAHQQAARGLPDEVLPQRSRRPRAGEGLQRQLLLWVLPPSSHYKSLFLDPSYSRSTLVSQMHHGCFAEMVRGLTASISV
jgi:hypothetical protein